jgi:hypothetical protein
MVTAFHGFPSDNIHLSRYCAPCVEAVSLLPDALQLLPVRRRETVEHHFLVDRAFYGIRHVALSFGVPCSEDEYLRHLSYSERRLSRINLE